MSVEPKQWHGEGDQCAAPLPPQEQSRQPTIASWSDRPGAPPPAAMVG